MQEYINEYQNINGEFASIISKSLEADNLQVHAKAASFMVSAKYCYITHELRLHQNDRCKRFTPV